NKREHDLATGVPVSAAALHVVDIIAEIGLEYNGTVNERARLNVVECDTPHTRTQTAVPAKSALQQRNVAAGHEGSVGDVIMRTALNREIAGGRSAYEKTDDVTHLVEAAFGNCNERAGKREALGDEHQRLHTLV